MLQWNAVNNNDLRKAASMKRRGTNKLLFRVRETGLAEEFWTLKRSSFNPDPDVFTFT